MNILNLTNAEKSEIKYKVSKFPDGQQNITINPAFVSRQFVQIKSRLNNWLDLELITCAVGCLRGLKVKEIELYVPYIVGARSDRKFETGGNNYVKDVIAPVINSLGFSSVTAIDPHSDVLEACINNFEPITNQNFISHHVIGEIIKSIDLPAVLEDKFHTTPKGLHYDKRGFDNIILIAPDAGAVKKIYKVADAIGYKDEIIVCSKYRDVEGKLTKTIVPLKTEHSNKQLIIIDDICDGGATFINIAKEIKSYGHRLVGQGGCWHSKLHLAVTHGIFSKGFEELSQYFDNMYCTNSYKDINLSQGINDVLGADLKLVKQFNVF